MRIVLPFALAFALNAQLIPAGSQIPKRSNPPVVFLNGYQFGCIGGATFAGTFGIADQILEQANIASVFFDNCTISGSPSIEALGIAFAQFLTTLQYTDGTPVTQVDIVAHSMGGLIVRCYLSGKQDVSPAVFSPPATVAIRKAIFLATPHFGTAVANLLGSDKQADEMQLGSQFLFDLATWNDANDDLRGLDALAIAGNGGTGHESGIAGFDDGLVTLTSASIEFARPGRTQVVPFCHIADSLLNAVDFCANATPGIADITSASDIVGQMVVSFLTGTTYWQNLGTPVTAPNTPGATLAGLFVEAADSNGMEQSITSAVAGSPGGVTLARNAVAYAEALPANTSVLQVQDASGVLSQTIALRAASGNAMVVKPGPSIGGAVTAGAAIYPYNVAPEGYVAVYGSGLTTLTQWVENLAPYATQLADVRVLVNNTPAQIQYVSQTQLNIVYPDVSPGPSQLTVISGAGTQTVTVIVVPAVPVIFSNGTTAAARIGSTAGDPVVNSTTPLHAGDVVELYATGLGETTVHADGLSWANIQPTVTVGGQSCAVTFAGLVPGFTGFGQINCTIPAAVTGAAVPVIATSNGRPSNTATLNIQ